jgi:NADP-dependent 3-hydroxy acid dehydrogenase YdfG
MPPPPPYSPYSLEGQCVLVTGVRRLFPSCFHVHSSSARSPALGPAAAGASAGIGEACAWRFAEAGCRLVLLARRADRLDALKAELEAAHGSAVHTVVLDVRDAAGVAALPAALPEAFRGVDILLNNAGLALGVEAADEVDLDDARTMLESNVLSVVGFTRAFTPGMRARNRGHVINISSVAAQEAYAGGSVYCATKHALAALTVAARHDFVGTDIRVTAISPGAVETEFSGERRRRGLAPKPRPH